MGRKKKDEEEKRVIRAAGLRAARFSWETIAKECGYYDASAARKSVLTFQQKNRREVADEAVLFELDLLDKISRGMMVAGTNGDIRAANVLLKCIDMRAKLLNMYPKPEAQESEGVRIVVDPHLLGARARKELEDAGEILEQAGEERPL